MNVVYISRTPDPTAHSIEELFATIQAALPDDIHATFHTVPFQSRGIWKRLANAVDVVFHRRDIQHITGDIHYTALFLNKKNTVLTIHDLGILEQSTSIKRTLLSFFWFTMPSRRVRYITVVSESTKKELLKHVSIPEEKVIVIPDCISNRLTYTPKDFNASCPVILQVGTTENKNLGNLCRAIEGLPCRLVILGRLDDRQTSMLKRHGIDFENRFNLTYDQVVELYQQADLVAFVSTYEGFGLPIIEANAVGRAVITGNTTSMPEVAADAALLVDPHDVAAVRGGIIDLIHNAGLRAELIANGLENRKRFTPEIIARQYAELYRAMVE